MPISHPDQGRTQLGLFKHDNDAINAKSRHMGPRTLDDGPRSHVPWASALGAMVAAAALVLLVVWMATI